MKNVKYYGLIGILVVFAACSDDITPEMENVTLRTEEVLDLQSMNYDRMNGVLSGISTTRQTIVLQDGSEQWSASMKLAQGVEIEEYGHPVSLFEGRDKDSINAVLSRDYATIRFQRHGELIEYVAYRNSDDMSKVVDYYRNHYLPVATRASSGEIIAYNSETDTRSGEAEIRNIRVNITKAINANPIASRREHDYSTGKMKIAGQDFNRQISAYPATLEFMLIKEQDGGSLEHDITAQIQAVTTSLEFLTNSGFITLKYTIKDCSHQSGPDALELTALYAFQTYLRSWDEVAGQDEKPYILLRDGTWDYGNMVGYASGLGMIHLNTPLGNFEVAALSTTSSLYPYTLAHEIGHLLGAEHVDNEQDLMYPYASENVTPNHLSADNWVKMLDSIQQ